ncbi:S8 family serine peptidase [Halobacillus yeomjeoni]|uniref:S8 family serine peptidase n=1 Tax=Halobacillus yeomjeoni TaxID=311194 RepID=A0A931HW44_9BACI|nr:S8 family serine peptidase [Halobacillus yeomjeoni]MBH0230588.1 S8 family serine peptidase [Halobacillus yeomjeoni]
MRNVAFLLIVVWLLVGFQSPGADEEVTLIFEVEGSSKLAAGEIESRIPRVEVLAVYDTIFNGVAIKGKVKELEKIARLDMVIQQYPVAVYQALYQKTEPFSTDRLRQSLSSSYTGKGVKVGVIDTGIDYHHPDLAGNYRGGFDTVDFDDDPMETVGYGETLHGTHVAGVIAANGKMKGIAPDAELYAYRALGPGGVGSSVQVIAAIEEAVEDGMDVINLSLGNDVNGPDWPTSHAVNKAIELGVTVVVAAGNSGPGAWTVGSPATSSEAITVGAYSFPEAIPTLTFPGEKKVVALHTLMGSKTWDLTKKYPLIHVGIGDEEIMDAKGKIVLFERGVIPFSEKALKAYRSGAAGVIIYNNEKGSFQGSLDGVNIPIPVAAVSRSAGKWLVEKGINENQWGETKFKEVEENVAPFSSRGPVTTTWDVKPDLLAPGVDIVSTVPGGYKALQGTSMAAPHVSGAVAVVKEAHPEWTPSQIKTAILSTADVLEKEGRLFQPTEQGRGVLDIEESINPSFLISPFALNFGRVKDEFFKKEIPIKVTNPTNQTFDLYFEQPDKKAGVTWRMPSSVSLSPGQSKQVDIHLQLSKTFVEEGIHEGFVTIRAGKDVYHIPFLYMKETADYKKVSGFELTKSMNTNHQLQYRFYLSENIERIKVALYRAGTMFHQGEIFKAENLKAGMNKGVISSDGTNLQGTYIAVVTVENNKEEEEYTFPIGFE